MMRSRLRCLYCTDQFRPFTDISGQRVASCRVSPAGCGFKPAVRFSAHETFVARPGPRERAWQGIKSVLTRAKLLKAGHRGLAEENVRRSLAFSGAVYTALIASWRFS